LLVRHVVAVCRVEATKHGEQGRFAERKASDGMKVPDNEAAGRNPKG
jgi:hypothetical protein